MGTIKDRNGMNLQKILRRDGKNTLKNYTEKVYLHNLDNHDSLITHLEPDILE